MVRGLGFGVLAYGLGGSMRVLRNVQVRGIDSFGNSLQNGHKICYPCNVGPKALGSRAWGSGLRV